MRPKIIALLAIVASIQIPHLIAAVQDVPTREPATQVNSPAARQQQTVVPAAGTEDRLRMFVGRSMVVRSPQPLKRVSVTDAAIASALIVSPNQIMIHGLKPGTITLILWDDQEQMRSFDLQVQLDIRSLNANLKKIYPSEKIEVSQSGTSLVLNGEVSSQAIADKAVALSQTEAPTIVNMLRIKPQAKQTFMLQVRFAEIDRAAVQQLGVNILSTGAGNTIGSTSTQQFGALTGSAGLEPPGSQTTTSSSAASKVAGSIGATLSGTPAVFGLSDLLNIFLFRADANLGVVIKALQQKNLLQMLAEPNLLAINGQEASFLAGGEFPFPVVQSGANSNAVTIQFKEFGVRLKFIANLLEDGKISLKVAPEVSTLDYSNALTISGFTIPALSTRRADTEVELRDGQSFAIAGLIDNRMTEIASKIPGLGDLPIIGKLFKSRALNRNKTELMVIVTPSLVKPLDPNQTLPLPEFPMSFLDNSKFDGKGEKALPVDKKGKK